MNLQPRELKDDDENPNVHDILYTGDDGTVRYSPDVYDSLEEAQAAAEELKKAGEPLDWWDVFLPKEAV